MINIEGLFFKANTSIFLICRARPWFLYMAWQKVTKQCFLLDFVVTFSKLTRCLDCNKNDELLQKMSNYWQWWYADLMPKPVKINAKKLFLLQFLTFLRYYILWPHFYAKHLFIAKIFANIYTVAMHIIVREKLSNTKRACEIFD